MIELCNQFLDTFESTSSQRALSDAAKAGLHGFGQEAYSRVAVAPCADGLASISTVLEMTNRTADLGLK